MTEKLFGIASQAPMRFYISGPMSGLPDSNYPYFKRVTSWLREHGYIVVCPTEINHPDENKSQEECLRLDLIKMLSNANTILLLRGWPDSRGTLLELLIAKILCFKIFICYERLGNTEDIGLAPFSVLEEEISLSKIVFLFIKRYAEDLL